MIKKDFALESAELLTRAQRILTEVATHSNKGNQLLEAQKLLELSVAGRPSDYAAQTLLVDLLLRTGQSEAALERLHQAVGVLPELNVALANLYRVKDNIPLCHEHAQVVVSHFRPLALQDATNIQANCLWAEAKLLLGDLAAAEQIIGRGQKALSDPRYDQVRIKLLLEKGRQAIAEEPHNATAAIDAWEAILSIDPAHSKALRNLSRQVENEAVLDRVVSILEKLTAESDTPLSAYQTLSGLACEEQNWSRAIGLCQDGLTQDPTAHGLMNNLAWALAHKEQPALKDALGHIQRAVDEADRLPIRLEYLATRGVILTKQGHWKQAIPDLEAVLRRAPDRRQVHQDLLQCYQQLGQGDLASILKKTIH